MPRAVVPLVLFIALSLILSGGDAASARPGGTLQEGVAAVETIQISDGQGGNSRYPAVAENEDGDRLIIFRGPDDAYWYSFSQVAGIWSAPAVIPDQPGLNKFLFADIEADSTGRFHCVWEQPLSVAMYASYKNRTWTTPARLPTDDPHEYGVSVGVRSNDEVVVVDTESVSQPSLTKDVFICLKKAADAQFQTSVNVTNESQSSAHAWSAVDDYDHVWIAYKEEWDPNPPEILGISLLHLDETNTLVEKLAVSEPAGWSFWPQVAVNSEDKVMTAWAHAQSNDYWSRLYDPAAGVLSSPASFGTGLSTNPWCTFYLRLAAHGRDFYAAAIDRSRILYLLKYDEAAEQWNRIAQISDRSVETFDLYAGNEAVLIVWGGYDDPADIFVSTVAVPPIVSPKPILTIQAGPGGTTAPGPGFYKYARGKRVSVRAVPDYGYRLSHWSGDASGDAANTVVTMDGDKTIQANFTSVPKPAADLAVTTSVDLSLSRKANALSWNRNPANAGIALSEYGVYRKNAGRPDGDFKKIGAVPADTFAYADAGLPLDQKYAYCLTAVALNPADGESGRSESVTEGSLFPPAAVSCRTVFNSSLFRKEKINIISWEHSPLNEGAAVVQYDIYRKAADRDDSEYQRIASVAGAAAEFQDRKLPLGERYVYAVKSIDTGGAESGMSNPAKD